MNQDHGGVYLPTDREGTFETTPLANAGWYEEGQHGGAIAALVVSVVEKVPTLAPMEIARLTLEIFRVVPLTTLTLVARTVREGRRIQTIEVMVSDGDGSLLCMAVAQRLRTADRPLPQNAQTPTSSMPDPDESAPTDPRKWGIGPEGKTMFHRDAIELREIHGGFSTLGPGAIWVRSTVPIVAGERVTAAQRAVIAADFCNGVSRELELDTWVFMNSDLTVHLGRYPVGEWVALDAESSYTGSGRGVAAGTLWDVGHWVGRSAQTLYLDRT